MDYLFNNILANTSTELTVAAAAATMLAAILFGGAIAFTYYKTQEESFQRSLAVTLLMLPVILAVIVLFVGSNIARAFSLAGTLSIIRFRSAPGDPKDIGFIFFDIAAGLACGVSFYGYGAIFVIVLCVLIVLCERFRLFEGKSIQKTLKITIPENLNYQRAFDDILQSYTNRYTLTKIRTTELGSLFEVCYHIAMKDDRNEQEFLNELRCRNGNLNIILTAAPDAL